MIFLDDRNRTTKRPTRPVPQSSRIVPQPPTTICDKTKCVISFLCLFDGLRIPSVRRLVRKSRTVCGKPLLSFDPSFYSPSTTSAIRHRYESAFGCKTIIVVDPSYQSVLQLLKTEGGSSPPHRLVFHYSGQGSHPPTSDQLFFFTEDLSRYKPLKIANILNSISCPSAFIFDCPASSILSTQLATRKDIIAFFACQKDEQLPLSIDIPLDIFSACLLDPFNTAQWYHLRNNRGSLGEGEILPPPANMDFLHNFFNALLDSIFFGTQPASTTKMFMTDPAMSILARGFVLSQKVMSGFNLHPTSLPKITGTLNHPLWGIFDLAIDCCYTTPLNEAIDLIFLIIVKTFTNYPSSAMFPLFSFFFQQAKFHEQICTILLDYLDANPPALEAACRSVLPQTIINQQEPSSESLVLLAKLIAHGGSTPLFTAQTPITFTVSKQNLVLRAGMLVLIMAIAVDNCPPFSRYTSICIEHAIDCAPYSALLLATLIEHSGHSINVAFASRFAPLVDSPHVGYRAALACLLGMMNDKTSQQLLTALLQDRAPVVRIQALYALARQGQVETIKSHQDSEKIVLEAMNEIKTKKIGNQGQLFLQNQLIASVNANGFRMRYGTNDFNFE